jgi:UDP-2,3-diacylglucosamine pyrophosphatase LpxH
VKSWCFVSDIHLNANWCFPADKPAAGGWSAQGLHGNTYPFEWLQPQQKGSLIRFLDQINPARTRGVSFLGDIFDNWIYPVDEEPPTIKDIVGANQDFFAAVRRLRKRNIAVVFLRGNHDMDMTADDLAAAGIGDFYFSQTDAIRIGPVRAEHGHAMCLFNARDMNSAFKPLPLGYFISRAVAAAASDHNVRSQTTGEILQGLLDHAILGEEIESVVLDTVLGEAQLKSDSTEFTMPDGTKTNVGAVKKIYSRVYENWPKGAMDALLAEKYGLGKVVASRFANDVRLVLCGHTHDSCLEGGGGQVYVNSGSWIRNDLTGDFVEILPDKDDKSLHVQLQRWDGRAQSVTVQKSAVLKDCLVDEDSWNKVTDVT